MDDIDYYEILGIDKSADQSEIKSAYRQLAQKYHPDANDAKNANIFFRLIQEAYEVLHNTEKRKIYDSRNGYSSNESENTEKDISFYECNYEQKEVNSNQIVRSIPRLLVKMLWLLVKFPLLLLLIFIGYALKVIALPLTIVGTLVKYMFMLVSFAGVIMFIQGWQSNNSQLMLNGGAAFVILLLFGIFSQAIPTILLAISEILMDFGKDKIGRD
ncbi:MAG: DnaJ domain-containing protein [Defluviitaleaceae bacterium]|nr:DnaJ domain-containing protein [Defluviitaleaceae bacterium]